MLQREAVESVGGGRARKVGWGVMGAKGRRGVEGEADEDGGGVVKVERWGKGGKRRLLGAGEGEEG